MRNLLIIGGLLVVALALGAWLYFKGPVSAPQTPSTSDASASTTAPEAKTIPFKKLGEGQNARNMPSRKNYAIYDAKEFANFWTQAHGDEKSEPPFVDFTKNYVIAVFAGTEPTGGYSISVSSVTESGTARSVAVVISAPGDTCHVIEEVTSPYQFVSVPLSDADTLAHTDQVTKKECPKPE